jgi:hypothetical protein
MIRGILRIALYVALGPFVGSFGAMIAIGLATFFTTGNLHDFAGWEALVSPQILVVSYTLGTLPALLTAVVSIVIDRMMTGWRHWLWVAPSGAIVSCVLAWLVFGTALVGKGLEPVVFTSVIGAAGALAGFVCAALFDGLAALLRRR